MAIKQSDFTGVVADSVLDLVGRTPVVRLQRVVASGMANVWAKLERQNPGGCVKERIGLAMIEAAERDGRLQPGSLIVEPTSGNTGIGLAMVAAFKGYRVILVMPDSVSVERRAILGLRGGIHATPGAQGMKGPSPESRRNRARASGGMDAESIRESCKSRSTPLDDWP